MKKVLFIIFAVLSVSLMYAKDEHGVYEGWAQMDIEGDELKEIEPSRTYIYRLAEAENIEDFRKFYSIFLRFAFEFRYNTKNPNVIQLVMNNSNAFTDFIFNDESRVIGRVGFYDADGKLFKKYTIEFRSTVSRWYLVHTGQVAKEICDFINTGNGCVRFVLPTNRFVIKGSSDFDLYVPSHWFYVNNMSGTYVIKEGYDKYLDVRL